MKTVLKKYRHHFRVWLISWNSFRSYAKYSGFWETKLNKVMWRLLLLAHSLEKGLGMEKGRKDFGGRKAKDLMILLKQYRDLTDNVDTYAYMEAVSVMNAYREFRIQNGLDVSMYSALDQYLVEVQKIEAGYESLSAQDVAYDAENFEKLCAIRHSVRSFNGQSVSKEEIDRAVALMRTAPSACNRQMVKVYCSMQREDNLKLAELVPGNTGFEKEPDKYLFITADMSAFDHNEVEQWYVNGGISVAFLQLAFTAYEIGSCVFQWPKDKARDAQVRGILRIPENEVIVSVLGIGHYEDRFNILKSTRKDTSEFVVYRD